MRPRGLWPSWRWVPSPPPVPAPAPRPYSPGAQAHRPGCRHTGTQASVASLAQPRTPGARAQRPKRSSSAALRPASSSRQTSSRHERTTEFPRHRRYTRHERRPRCRRCLAPNPPRTTRAFQMTDAVANITPQAARKQRNDRLVRWWTTAATTLAIGLAGAFTGLATAPPARGSTIVQPETPGASADAVLTAAIADYAAAASRRVATVTPARTHAQLAPAPPPAPSRPRAVAVSGGS
jgi:hypothetical protein